MGEIRHFWCCANCGCEFETWTVFPKTKLPPELIKDFFPALLVA